MEFQRNYLIMFDFPTICPADSAASKASFKLNADLISGASIVFIFFKKQSYLLYFKYSFHVKGVIVEQVLSINWLSASLTSFKV